MRILITNDDGINSPALPRLIRWAQRLGEVTAVAPKVEQSGKSQAIDFYRQIEIKRVEIEKDLFVYSVDSTPADCVRYGIIGLKKQYDLVISGINRGYNLGHDIVYSGTIGAILEGARLGVKGIALSTDTPSFDPAFSKLDGVFDFIFGNKLLERAELLNVNIPLESHAIKITRQGGIYFSDEFVPLGNDMYIQEGAPVPNATDNIDYDIVAMRAGYVSITPLINERTDLALFEKIKNL